MGLDWGVLSGLGSGLQQVGSQISKSALDEKLTKAREERASQLEINREARAEARKASEVAETKLETGTEGELWQQDYNYKGKPIGERKLADKTKIDAIRAAEVEAKQKATKSALDIAIGERKLEDYDINRNLDLDYKRAGIDQRLASAERSRVTGQAAMIRANKPNASDEAAATATPREYANLLKTEASGIIAQYKVSKENTNGLTAAQIDDVANQAVKIAAAKGEDPIEVMKRLLEDEAGRRKGSSSLEVRMTDGI